MQCASLHESVLLVFNDGHRYFCDVGHPFRVREIHIPSQALIGAPYGSVWEIVGQRGLLRVASGELIPQSLMGAAVPSGAGAGGEEEGEEEEEEEGREEEAEMGAAAPAAGGARPLPRDNRNLVDTSSAQALTAEDVWDMRRRGQAGEDIVKALAGSSSTFAGKTQFSQEKYLKKKVFKHIRRFRVTRCSAHAIADTLLAAQPERTAGLRTDSLAAMLAQADVRSGATALIFDGAQGLLTGACAERMCSAAPGSPFSGYLLLANSDAVREVQNTLPLLKHFNLAATPGIDTAMAAVRYSELVDWAPGISAVAPQAPHLAAAAAAAVSAAAGSAAGAEAAPAPSSAAPSHSAPAGLKRPRDAPPAAAAAAATAAHAFAPPGAQRKLAPYPYSPPALQHLLGRGVDSLLMAPNLDPGKAQDFAALALSALRYVRPSGSFALFHQQPLQLAQLAVHLASLKVAVNVQLAETWTREQQVLPGRTHPFMSMHGASGFVLSGTVVENAWSCVHMSLRAPAPRRAREKKHPVPPPHTQTPQPQQQQQLTDVQAMLLACQQAAQCPRSDRGYSVGAVLVDAAKGEVVCMGHSREVPPEALVEGGVAWGAAAAGSSSASASASAPASSGVHAEEVVLWRLAQLRSAAGSASAPPPPPRALTLYSSMEPCSRRLSGATPCAAHILAAGITRLVVAVREPKAFLQDCCGLEELRAAGVQVSVLEDAACRSAALAPNAHLALPA